MFEIDIVVHIECTLMCVLLATIYIYNGASPRGYSKFFFIRRLGPSIYPSPPKNIRNFKLPLKIFEILATPKISPFLTTLRKDPKMHRND